MTLQHLAAIVAMAFGGVTIVEGGGVLAGADPGYIVFRPLLVYNAGMGLVYVVAGLQAWRDPRHGRTWAGAIALLNLLVLCAITAAYAGGAGVAAQSLAAMTVRTLVWGGLFLALARAARRMAASEATTDAGEMEDEGWVIRPVDDARVTLASFYAVDHGEIDRLFERYCELPDAPRPAVVEAFRAFKARLERHIGWEEQILFPLFERLTGGADNGPTVVMRGEHRTIVALLDRIERTLESGGAGAAADEAALQEALAAHNLKEEQILYPLIDRQASAADREAVFKRMDEPPV